MEVFVNNEVLIIESKSPQVPLLSGRGITSAVCPLAPTAHPVAWQPSGCFSRRCRALTAAEGLLKPGYVEHLVF